VATPLANRAKPTIPPSPERAKYPNEAAKPFVINVTSPNTQSPERALSPSEAATPLATLYIQWRSHVCIKNNTPHTNQCTATLKIVYFDKIYISFILALFYWYLKCPNTTLVV
jgi:hypothetical protein